MSLLGRIPRSYVHPGLRQAIKKSDGVRGLFTRRPITRGSLLVLVPSEYCCFPFGLSPHRDGETLSLKAVKRAALRCRLFSDLSFWVRNFCCSAEGEIPPCLHASCSSSGDVISLQMSPAEAALSCCVALRFFRRKISGNPIEANRCSVGEAYVNSLPLSLVLNEGVELFFTGESEVESSLHICLEQLALNIRDAVMQHLNNEDYRAMDRKMDYFDDILLAALYVLRSRTLPMLFVRPPGAGDSIVQCLAPGVDAINHSSAPNAAAAASLPHQSVVVRAIRNIARNSEITIDYNLAGMTQSRALANPTAHWMARLLSFYHSVSLVKVTCYFHGFRGGLISVYLVLSYLILALLQEKAEKVMLSKVLSGMMHQRLQPAMKFPQLRLHAKAQKQILTGRPFVVRFDAFDKSNLDFISKEVDAGQVVELRQSNGKLTGLGFFEPVYREVQIFDWTPASMASLPTIDESFFVGRLQDALERRVRSLPKYINCFRVVHGAEDGFPSLEVDQFSQRLYTISAHSYGANRLIPPVAEFLRRQGAEALIVESPTLKMQRIRIINPSIPLSSPCVENGVSFSCPLDQQSPSALICCAHRRSRFLLREISSGKRVLTINDRHGMGALNAVMSASKVTIASSDSELLAFARENLIFNHGKPIFEKCETFEGPVTELLTEIPYDVVFMEHHSSLLFSAPQWRDTLSALVRRGSITAGTVIIACHKSSPETGFKTAEKMFSIFFQENNLSCRLVRSFGASIDYPKTPSSRFLSHFSHVYQNIGSNWFEDAIYSMCQGGGCGKSYSKESLRFFLFALLMQMMKNEDFPADALKERARSQVKFFDAALGAPPFDNPSPDTLAAADDFYQFLVSLDPVQRLAIFRDVEEVVYTFPILCAAVPEGSSSVNKDLFRPLLKCLSLLAPVLKYPLDAVVKSAIEVFSFQDADLFLFLRDSNFLNADYLRKFLRISQISKEDETQKKNRKKQGRGAVEEPIPHKLLLAIISSPFDAPLKSVVSSFIMSKGTFEAVTKGDSDLAAVVLDHYGEVMSLITPRSLLEVLSANIWDRFVAILEKEKSAEIAAEPVTAKKIFQSCAADSLHQLGQKALASSVNLNPWGSLLGLFILFQCLSMDDRHSALMEAIVCGMFDRCAAVAGSWSVPPVSKSDSHKKAQTGIPDWPTVLERLFDLASYRRCRPLLVGQKIQNTATKLRKIIVEALSVKSAHADCGADQKLLQKAKKNNKGKSAVSTISSHSSQEPPFTESFLQQNMKIVLALDDLLQSESRKMETLQVLQEAIRRLEKKNCVSAHTWILFLQHVEFLGTVDTTLTFKNETLLFQQLTKATACASSAKWVDQLLHCSHKVISSWVVKWPTALAAEVFVALCRSKGDAQFFPQADAGLLFNSMGSHQVRNVLRALDAAGQLLMVQHFLENRDRRIPADISVGPQRLLTSIQEYISDRDAKEQERKKLQFLNLSEKLNEKIALETQLYVDTQKLKQELEEKEATYRQQQETIRDLLRKQREERELKKEMAERQRERRRQCAIATAARMKAQSAQERLEKRRKDLQQYREASLRAFRASSFLHALGLTTSQVVSVIDNVVSKKPDVMPDDLLEYIVTGTAAIPRDIMDPEEQQGDQPESPPSDFWDDVLNDKTPPKKPDHSFHYQVQRFLDLFCYEGGDAYGTLPNPLPRISLKVCKKLLTSEDVSASGFHSLDEVFMSLSQKKLVRVKNEIAELTVLGFRYHFPFHNPEGMLEVLLRNQKERALALLTNHLSRTDNVDREAYSESDEGEEDMEEDEFEEWESAAEEEEELEDRNRTPTSDG
eukprot:gene5971-4280_t